ncbi:hexapeptide repeat-containing transferase [Methanococcus maripaludis]|uniref:Serine acetyltransferase n=2 Tax=Methanococcus maripaludis TaxID=39152 RepID=A0A7J9PH53_METMI|nr:hexapeptide repeat-containing transferase [Methanococcus maripaludis]MBA2862114.1 serine acetyltransferase [Methanococcus maripaludis]
MKERLYAILTLNPNFYIKPIPKQGNSIFSRILHHMLTSIISILLSGEYPNTDAIKCRFGHHVGIVVSEAAEIGENTVIQQNTTIGRNLKTGNAPKIGNFCRVGSGGNIIGHTKIADNVTVGAGCNIAESKIGANTKIGMGCTIVHTKIGKNCKILSGAVLNGQEIPDNSIVKPVISNIMGPY